MLPNRMITKLAKAYTKRTIANEGPQVAKTVWSNGHVLFWETPPDFVANHYAAQEKPALDKIIIPQNMPALYPVEIRSYENFPVVKLTDGNGSTHWLNGKYLSAAIKQAKRQAKNVTFTLCATEDSGGKSVTGILAQLLNRPLALIGLLREDYLHLEDKAPDWQTTNNDLPMPVYAGRPEYINPDLVTQFRLL